MQCTQSFPQKKKSFIRIDSCPSATLRGKKARPLSPSENQTMIKETFVMRTIGIDRNIRYLLGPFISAGQIKLRCTILWVTTVCECHRVKLSGVIYGERADRVLRQRRIMNYNLAYFPANSYQTQRASSLKVHYFCLKSLASPLDPLTPYPWIECENVRSPETHRIMNVKAKKH